VELTMNPDTVVRMQGHPLRCAAAAWTAVAFCAVASAAPLPQQPGRPTADKPATDAPASKPLDPLQQAERDKLVLRDLEGWKKLQVKSLDQVMDVKKATQPLEYPASVTAEDKGRMEDLLRKARDGGGGARTGRALREIEKLGHAALLFLVNQLREIDYKDPTDSMFGAQINMSLQNITMGVNTGYVPVEVGEPMDPRKAQWNAMTVQRWQDGVRAWWPTKEKFDEYIQKRKAKKDAELDENTKDGGKDEGPPSRGR
jgi:hypothetical protein